MDEKLSAKLNDGQEVVIKNITKDNLLRTIETLLGEDIAITTKEGKRSYVLAKEIDPLTIEILK